MNCNTLKKIQILVVFLLFCSILALSVLCGRNISVMEQMTVLGSLAISSFVVLAVAGLWSALMAPTILNAIENSDLIADIDRMRKNYSQVCESFVISAGLVILNITLTVLHPILAQWGFLAENIISVRAVLYFTVLVYLVCFLRSIYIFCLFLLNTSREIDHYRNLRQRKDFGKMTSVK